ncbi:MAG TPA: MarR family transcriptional regulator [Gemmatimonadales bacterium]|nr:MarR family transcriptional regulator [Gemmatimonadales bacterium]
MPESPPTEQLTAGLLLLARALRVRQGELLAPHGLHPGQDALLVEVCRNPGLRQSELADRLEVEPPTVTRMVRRMERGGLLERHSDPDDSRLVRIQPTQRARLLEALVRRAWSDLDAEMIGRLGAADAERLRRLVVTAAGALRSEAS